MYTRARAHTRERDIARCTKERREVAGDTASACTGLTYAAYGAESTTRVLHPPGHIVLGDGILSGPLHDRCYFLAKRLEEKKNKRKKRKIPHGIDERIRRGASLIDILKSVHFITIFDAVLLAPLCVS